IFPRAISGRGPGMTFSEDVGRQRRRGHRTGAGPSLDAVSVHDEAAPPVGRYLDLVVRAAQRAGSAERRRWRIGARRVIDPRRRRQEQEPEQKQRREDPHHFARSFTSSYGPENGKPVMSPSPDSSTRGP